MIKEYAKSLGIALALFLIIGTTSASADNNSTPMVTLDSGIVMKVTPRSDKVSALTEPGGGSEAYPLDVLAPYFVMELEGGYYKITDIPATKQEEATEGNVGYVAEDLVHIWPTREALHFSPLLFTGLDRVSIEAWEEKESVAEFLLTGDKEKYAPSFEEKPEVTRKKPKFMRPYPVLGKEELPSLLGRPKTVYNALFPTWVVGTDVEVVVKANQAEIEKAFKSVTFAVVFDATGSMSPYAEELSSIISDLTRSASVDQDLVRMGFVFFRDLEDDVPIEVIEPVELPLALRTLKDKAGEMVGGGDAAEPVLDALVETAARFNWVGSQGIAGSRRIAIVVLNSDAKLKTIGLGEAETGLSAEDVARLLKEQEITAITFQAGEAEGENLVYTLDLLAKATGGDFARHVGDDREATVRSFGSALEGTLAGTVASEKKETDEILKWAVPEGKELTSIPLAVISPGHLNRLSELAGNYNIGETGGLLVTDGWIPGDENLLERKVSIDKETLNALIGFFNVLASVTVTADDLMTTVTKNLEGIIGEKVDPNLPLDEIISRKLGINFETELLSYDVNYLFALTPTEKTSMQKRMQDAGDRLTTFLESSIAELDTEPTVWMPLSYLP